jgi:hypothetical protein
MIYIIAGLAVYKAVHILDVLTPKEAMPWVKVTAATVLAYGVSFILDVPNKWTAGLVIATIASACHGLMRLVTFLGDMAHRKSIK